MYPVRYEADYIQPQNRWKAFFRWILVIPWAILAAIYGLIAQIVAVLAWFALLATGRYPQGLYDFQAGYLRFTGRLLAFTYLQAEEWPPFGFDDDRRYPVRVDVDPPLEHYNRWKTGFRLILAFPVYVMLNLMPYLSLFGAGIAWLHIVFMGRTSGGVHNLLTVGNAYQLRAISYLLLVTETIPPISDQQPAENAPAAPARRALGRGAGAATSRATAVKPKAKAAAAKPKAKAPVRRASAAAKKPAAKKAAAKKAAARKPAAKKSSAKRRATGGRS